MAAIIIFFTLLGGIILAFITNQIDLLNMKQVIAISLFSGTLLIVLLIYTKKWKRNLEKIIFEIKELGKEEF